MKITYLTYVSQEYSSLEEKQFWNNSIEKYFSDSGLAHRIARNLASLKFFPTSSESDYLGAFHISTYSHSSSSTLSLPILFFFFNVFIYFWLHCVFIAVHGLSLVAASGGHSSLRCAGFSLWWLLLLRSTGSRRAGFSSCGSRALERRLSSCGTWA